MTEIQETPAFKPMAERFRGYLPVVVDVETGGFDWNKHALLEIAAVPIELDPHGRFVPGEVCHAHIEPAPGTSIDPKSLEVTGIKIGHPLRFAVDEREGLDKVFVPVRAAAKKHGCQRAILVGVFDTVTMAGLMYGQTVLARAIHAAGLDWDQREAHSAVYDAERTAQLFCIIANAWPRCGPSPGAMPEASAGTIGAMDGAD